LNIRVFECANDGICVEQCAVYEFTIIQFWLNSFVFDSTPAHINMDFETFHTGPLHDALARLAEPDLPSASISPRPDYTPKEFTPELEDLLDRMLCYVHEP
jgi:hypothetical protein